MKKIAILGSILAVATSLALWGFNEKQGASLPRVYRELKRHDSQFYDRVRGEYFLLHFWAKWCEPCLDEIPDLIRFSKAVLDKKTPEGKIWEPAKKLTIVAVSLDPTLDESRLILPNQGRDLPVSFQLLHDPDQKFATALGSFQYPETYLVDPRGEIVEKWVGVQKWLHPQVFEFFNQKLR